MGPSRIVFATKPAYIAKSQEGETTHETTAVCPSENNEPGTGIYIRNGAKPVKPKFHEEERTPPFGAFALLTLRKTLPLE